MDCTDVHGLATNDAMKRKAVILSRYSRRGASSRLRMYQYLPFLSSFGLDPEIYSFFDDNYSELYSNGRSTSFAIARAIKKRIYDLSRLRSAKMLWIEKEALPWFPWQIERELLPLSTPIVTDFDDAIFHQYDLHKSSIVRCVYGKKIDAMMAASSLVLAGNTYLADRALATNARCIEIIPTVVDVENYKISLEPEPAATQAIGWIGSPSTWKEYVKPMIQLFLDVASRHDARILVVGAGKLAMTNPLLDNFPWEEDKEVDLIKDMSIGIMPLTDTPWARGKCGYKLIQYMACGIPVVASPVGVNVEIVEHGVNGFLAETRAEWRETLTMLLRDPALRNRMGREGRRKVEQKYSLQMWGPRVAELLNEVAEKGQVG